MRSCVIFILEHFVYRVLGTNVPEPQCFQVSFWVMHGTGEGLLHNVSSVIGGMSLEAVRLTHGTDDKDDRDENVTCNGRLVSGSGTVADTVFFEAI